MNKPDPKWIVLTWRLPSGSSTPRVTTWRTLKRMGAVLLSPGAAVVPFSDEQLEQFEWLAERIEENDGEAWVLPVTDLSEREEARIRARMRSDRAAEYQDLRRDAATVDAPVTHRDVASLERRYRSVIARDHFRASGRARTAQAIARVRAHEPTR